MNNANSYTFLIPSPINHLDPDVPLHSITVWRTNPDPMQAEPMWHVQYRFDDETYFETAAANFQAAMVITRSMLVDACDMGEPDCEALRTEYKATWAQGL